MTDAERRRAMSLACADALALASPLDDKGREALGMVLRRLADPTPLGDAGEVALLSLLDEAGLQRCPALDEGPLSSLAAEVRRDLAARQADIVTRREQAEDWT